MSETLTRFQGALMVEGAKKIETLRNEALVEKVAEAIWQAEDLRARGHRRSTLWAEGVSEEDRGRYRFIAREIIPVVLAERN